MQSFTLRKAERKQAKIRMGIFGPSGSGKTYSALLVAKGIAGEWNKVAVIDTENGSADLYSHFGDYNVITLEAPFSPEKYVEAIQACEKAGVTVIIVDSVSHEWDGKGGCLESNDLIAHTTFKGNTWAAWSKTTPRHQKFIEALTSSSCHIITCGRSKTDTIQTEDKKIKKVGLKDIQREGFEYEMTLSMNLDRDGHYATASKDRTRIFIDKDPFVITEETGSKIKEWSESGAVDLEAIKAEIFDHLKRLDRKPATKAEAEAIVKELSGLELKAENYTAIAKELAKKKTPEAPKQPPVALAAPAAQKEPAATTGVQPAVESPARAEVKEPVEPEETISANKLTLLRSLAKDKEGLTDDNGILFYVNWFFELTFEKIEDLPASLGNKVIHELMMKKSVKENKPEEEVLTPEQMESIQ